MKNLGKLAAIEKQLSKADNGGGECTAYYKVGRGNVDGRSCTIAEAFEAALRGDLEAIHFPLTHDESMALHQRRFAAVYDALGEYDGVVKDPDCMVKCSKPYIIVTQHNPIRHFYTGGMPEGGWFDLPDGKELHERDARKYMEDNGVLLICPNYDETIEPWYKAIHEKKG